MREEVIGQLCHPRPREVVLLTAAPQRAQPEAHHLVAKGAECREANNPQQSWGFEGEPPEAVIKNSGTRVGTS